MIQAGDRVKYTGKTGNGLFHNEVGTVKSMLPSNIAVIELKDKQLVNLSVTDISSAPAIIPILGYTLLGTTLVAATWIIFSRQKKSTPAK